jgi:hypothetical protein
MRLSVWESQVIESDAFSTLSKNNFSFSLEIQLKSLILQQK